MTHDHEHPHDHGHSHPHSHPEVVAPPPDWFQRNWKWALPLGCGTMVVLFLSVTVGLAFVVFASLRSSDAYAGAMERVRAHPEAIEALGAPIEAGWLVTGNISVSGPSGNAQLAIPVTGSKGTGAVYVNATKEAGVWVYERLELQVEGGERIDLLTMGVPSGVTV